MFVIAGNHGLLITLFQNFESYICLEFYKSEYHATRKLMKEICEEKDNIVSEHLFSIYSHFDFG